MVVRMIATTSRSQLTTSRPMRSGCSRWSAALRI
jgi:hypothetical protein